MSLIAPLPEIDLAVSVNGLPGSFTALPSVPNHEVQASIAAARASSVSGMEPPRYSSTKSAIVPSLCIARRLVVSPAATPTTNGQGPISTSPAKIGRRWLAHDLRVHDGRTGRLVDPQPEEQVGLGSPGRGEIADVEHVAPPEPFLQPCGHLLLRGVVVPADRQG